MRWNPDATCACCNCNRRARARRNAPATNSRRPVAVRPEQHGEAGSALARELQESGRAERGQQLQPRRTRPAQRACDEFAQAGGGMETVASAFAERDNVVDALFGFGLGRAAEGEA